MKKYLFIARKDDSADYCRGCLMASYSSDFEVRNHLSEDELVRAWAEYLYQNMKLRFNESGYEFHIFENGVKVWEGDSAVWDGEYRYEYDSEEYWAKYETFDTLRTEAQNQIVQIYNKALAIAMKRKEDFVAKEKREAEEKALKEAEAAKEQRRKEFEKLQAEFGQ